MSILKSIKRAGRMVRIVVLWPFDMLLFGGNGLLMYSSEELRRREPPDAFGIRRSNPKFAHCDEPGDEDAFTVRDDPTHNAIGVGQIENAHINLPGQIAPFPLDAPNEGTWGYPNHE